MVESKAQEVSRALKDVEACLDDAVRWLVALAGRDSHPSHIQNCRNQVDQARFYAKKLAALLPGPGPASTRVAPGIAETPAPDIPEPCPNCFESSGYMARHYSATWYEPAWEDTDYANPCLVCHGTGTVRPEPPRSENTGAPKDEPIF